MARSFLPSADADLLAWSANFNTLIVASPIEYGVTAGQAAAYTDRNDAFATAYQTAFDPNTRTAPAIEAKITAKNELCRYARELVRIIQANPAVTDAQRRALKITVRKSRSTINPPTVRPGLDIVSATMYTVTVYVHDTASSTKRSKPDDCVCAWVYFYAGETYPSDPGMWEFSGSTTRGMHEINLPETMPAGQQIWVTAAWVNAKQEAGPVAVPVSTNVQGGGSTSATKIKIAA